MPSAKSEPDRVTPGYLDSLESLLRIVFPVSPLARRLTGRNDQALIAERILSRMLLTGSSIVRLCKPGYEIPDVPSWIDLTAVASLARNLLEGYEALEYFYFDQVSEAEADFRLELFVLHRYSEQRKVYDALDVDESSNPFGSWDFIRQHAAIELRRNPFFKSLPPKTQSSLLSGRRAFYRRPTSHLDPASGVDSRDGIYKLLSNFVHSHPFAVHMHASHRLWPELNQSDVLSLSLFVATRYLAIATVGWITRRRFRTRVGRSGMRMLKAAAALERPPLAAN